MKTKTTTRPKNPPKSLVKTRTKGPGKAPGRRSSSSHPPTRKTPIRRKSTGVSGRSKAIREASENCECGLPLVMPFGPLDAKIGVIGEYPGEVELKTRTPLTGPTGHVFWSEWKRAGLPYARVTNVWQHMPTDDANDYEINLTRAIQHVIGCKIILLLGGTATNAFLESNVMKVSGLWSSSLLLGLRPVIAAPNPAVALRSTVGEFRLTLARLKQRKELR